MLLFQILAATVLPNSFLRYGQPYRHGRCPGPRRGRSNTEARPFPLFLAETFGARYLASVTTAETSTGFLR